MENVKKLQLIQLGRWEGNPGLDDAEIGYAVVLASEPANTLMQLTKHVAGCGDADSVVLTWQGHVIHADFNMDMMVDGDDIIVQITKRRAAAKPIQSALRDMYWKVITRLVH